MADCQSLVACPFFNDKMANMPTIAGLMKRHKCQGYFEDCARYMVKSKKGKEMVPDNLFPNQKERALQIINEP